MIIDNELIQHIIKTEKPLKIYQDLFKNSDEWYKTLAMNIIIILRADDARKNELINYLKTL